MLALTPATTAGAQVIVDYFLTFIGVFNPNSRWYLFWGGFGSCLTEFAIVGFIWRKVNCHAKGCWRVGLHHVDGTPFITCKKHHPAIPGSRAVTAEQIAEAHHHALARVREALLGDEGQSPESRSDK